MLKIPNGRSGPSQGPTGGRIPKPDEIVIFPQAMLGATIKIAESLKGLRAKWGINGDAGEMMSGVSIQNLDHIEILTTKDGANEMCGLLSKFVTLPPASVEKKLPREADIGGKLLPVFVKGLYAELNVDGVKVEIYGDEQIKVADWEWGDPLDFDADYIYVVGLKVPLVPLRLKSELALGLGWLDRVELISEAVMRSHHRH